MIVGNHRTMKSILPLLLFLFAAQTAFSTDKPAKPIKLIPGEERLIRYALDICNARTADDSLNIIFTIIKYNRKCGIGRIKFVRNGTGTSHCLPGFFRKSTLMINLADTVRICEMWAGELLHGEQYQEALIQNLFKASKGFIEAGIHAQFLTDEEMTEVHLLRESRGCKFWIAKLWVGYRPQYFKKRSFEKIHDKEPRLRCDIFRSFAGL